MLNEGEHQSENHQRHTEEARAFRECRHLCVVCAQQAARTRTERPRAHTAPSRSALSRSALSRARVPGGEVTRSCRRVPMRSHVSAKLPLPDGSARVSAPLQSGACGRAGAGGTRPAASGPAARRGGRGGRHLDSEDDTSATASRSLCASGAHPLRARCPCAICGPRGAAHLVSAPGIGACAHTQLGPACLYMCDRVGRR